MSLFEFLKVIDIFDGMYVLNVNSIGSQQGLSSCDLWDQNILGKLQVSIVDLLYKMSLRIQLFLLNLATKEKKYKVIPY